MKSKWRRIAFVSCTHVGSTVALWPESVEFDDIDLKTNVDEHEKLFGRVLSASSVQLRILEYWNDFWTHEAATADTIVLLGDLCQGKNPKDFGLGSMSTDLEIQKGVIVSLLEPHIQGRQLIGVSGSKYHDSFDMRLDQQVIEKLGGRYIGMLQNVKLKGPGTMLNIAHGSSMPSMYKGSHDDREIMLMSANGMTRGIDFAARGHWHYYHFLQNSSRAILRVPGWQCWYPARFMMDMLGKKNNKLGAVVIDFGPNKEYIPYPKLYEAPLTWGAPIEI